MNIKNFKETGAAYVHNTNAVPGDPLPMVNIYIYILKIYLPLTLFFKGMAYELYETCFIHYVYSLFCG